MSTPMWDVPDHMMMPVTVDGDGPAEGEDVHHLACWCGNQACDVELNMLRDLVRREDSDTARRLAALEAERGLRAAAEQQVRAERNALSARLTGLLDAIDLPELLRIVAVWAGERVPEHGEYLLRIADAAAAAVPSGDDTGPTTGGTT